MTLLFRLPAHHPAPARLGLVAGLLLGLCGAGCVVLDADAPGPRGVVARLSWSDASADSLVSRGTLSLQSTAPLSFPHGPARSLQVSAGAHRLPVTAVWSPVDLTLTYQLAVEPPVGPLYSVEVDPSAVRDLRGARPDVPLPIRFRLDEPLAAGAWQREATPPPSFDGDVAPLLTRCAPCHALHDGLTFTWDSLVLQRAASDSARYLVDPGAPEESVLLMRLLEAYTEPGQRMPPYWGDVTPLTREEALVLERWIRAGAP